MLPGSSSPLLIEALYGVALEPSLWPGWLARLCGALDARAALFVRRFPAPEGGADVVAVGLHDGENGARRASPRAARRPHASAFVTCLSEPPRLLTRITALASGALLVLPDPPTSIAASPDAPSRKEQLAHEAFLASPLHREWLRPHALHHLVLTSVRRSWERQALFVLLRGPSGPAFGESELQVLRALVPHLERVVGLQERIRANNREQALAHHLFESLHCAALLLDEEGRVSRTNRRAAALLEKRQGLVVEQGHLCAERPEEDLALRGIVAAALGNGTRPVGGALTITRRTGRALVASVSPLATEDNGPVRPGRSALVLIADPDRAATLPAAALCQLYRLTRGEARVAARLARGETLEEIAELHGVDLATVRTQLQRTFEKTGTHRQAELVLLLAMATVVLPEPLPVWDVEVPRNGAPPARRTRPGARDPGRGAPRVPC